MDWEELCTVSVVIQFLVHFFAVAAAIWELTAYIRRMHVSTIVPNHKCINLMYYKYYVHSILILQQQSVQWFMKNRCFRYLRLYLALFFICTKNLLSGLAYGVHTNRLHLVELCVPCTYTSINYKAFSDNRDSNRIAHTANMFQTQTQFVTVNGVYRSSWIERIVLETTQCEHESHQKRTDLHSIQPTCHARRTEATRASDVALSLLLQQREMHSRTYTHPYGFKRFDLLCFLGASYLSQRFRFSPFFAHSSLIREYSNALYAQTHNTYTDVYSMYGVV